MAEPTGSGIIAVCSCRARLLGRTMKGAWLPVTLTGIAEIAGAVGLVIPRLVPWAAGYTPR
jgi:hypothetical protein